MLAQNVVVLTDRRKFSKEDRRTHVRDSKSVGLKMSMKKTKVMFNNHLARQ